MDSKQVTKGFLNRLNKFGRIVSAWKRLWLTLLFLGWSLCALPATAQKARCSCGKSCSMPAAVNLVPEQRQAVSSETADDFCGVPLAARSVARTPGTSAPCSCKLEDNSGPGPVKLDCVVSEPMADGHDLVLACPVFRLLLAAASHPSKQVLALPAGWVLPASPPVGAHLLNLPPPRRQLG